MKPVSEQLFSFRATDGPRPSFSRCSARDLGLPESWLRDAIFSEPELVIGPCRSAGLTEDEWYAWQRELTVEVGSIDVLLISASGRVAIVETKLASNPELRRRVLAQALDYLVHLPDRLDRDMPEIPEVDGEPVADEEDVRETVADGDVLVIIASDETDPRVARLSGSLLSEHLVKHWDLALVDVGLYKSSDPSDACVVVPHLRNLVESEPRQVVRVVVEGEEPRARIEVERFTPNETSTVREKWDENRFMRHLDSGEAPDEVEQLAMRLRDVARSNPETLSLSWGTGKEGSMVVKRNNGGLIEIHGSGVIKFRPSKFVRALGEEEARRYRRSLEEIAPETMQMQYPQLAPEEAQRLASDIGEILEETLERIEEAGP